MKFVKLCYSSLALFFGIVLTFGLTVETNAAEFNIAKERVGDGIPNSLTGKKGNATKGRATAIHRKKGNCLACHEMPVPEQADHGNIGPSLVGVGSRYSIAELRLRLVDPKTVNPDTIMPSYFKILHTYITLVCKYWISHGNAPFYCFYH